MRVREPAPGKVNLALFLGPLRADGRHELVTLIESVSLADELAASPLQADAVGDEVICAGVEGPNLVTAALEALREQGWAAPPLKVEIRKHVPVAAGMGGGSADAAAMLRLADRIEPLAPGIAAPIAERLGADVPSQLLPGLALATGAGEHVEQREPLAEHALVIVPQPHRLSTAEVYAEADRLGLPRSQQELAAKLDLLGSSLAAGARPPDALLVNDLEPAALSLCPPIDAALDALRAAGADRALVCGSGPTAAGICWGEGCEARADAIAAEVIARFPGALAALPASSSTSGTIWTKR